MHAKSGGSSGEPPDFLFIPAACRSRKDLPRSAGGGDRARNTGNRPRDAEDGATGTGAGCGARVRNTEDAGVGRRTQNAEHVDADAGTGARGAGRRTQDAEHGLLAAGSRTRETGARSAEDGRRGHGVQDAEHGLLAAGSRTRETRARGAGDGAQETGHKPPCMDRSATAYTRPAPQQPAWTVHSRAPSAAGRRYLSRVRIRITPLPPRTPYMLLPRCTSTDLTS